MADAARVLSVPRVAAHGISRSLAAGHLNQAADR